MARPIRLAWALAALLATCAGPVEVKGGALVAPGVRLGGGKKMTPGNNWNYPGRR